MKLTVAQLLMYSSLCLSYYGSIGQKKYDGDITSKQSINLELAGKGFLLGNVSYEYAFKPQFSMGIGLGFTNISSGEILRNNNGTNETGRYLDITSSQLLYANYFIGKRKHKLILTAGAGHILSTFRNKYPTEREFSTESNFLPNIGLGYQLTGRHLHFRLTAYGFKFPEPTGWFPEYMPWGGLTLGYRF